MKTTAPRAQTITVELTDIGSCDEIPDSLTLHGETSRIIAWLLQVAGDPPWAGAPGFAVWQAEGGVTYAGRRM